MAPPTSVTSLAGQSIDNGRLTLIKMIGTGGYGAIYHAIDTRTRASYAVKVLEKRSNQRWTREAHLHLKVSSHPNVVTLHKILDDSGDLVYLVLDYCPGGDLNTMLMNTRIFAGENDLLKSVFLQIVGAVAHCHSKGIYHRDLKPENILCSKDGSRVFLADFGLASQSTSSTSFAVGTSQYMSPECLKSNGDSEAYSNGASDIWALGVILLNLITGRAPWHAARMTDLYYRSFIDDWDYFRSSLPVSKPSNDLLHRILDPYPPTRITLLTLGEEISKLDTFYMSVDEITRSNRNVREAAVQFGPLTKFPYPSAYLLAVFDSESSATDSDGFITPPYSIRDPCDEVPDINIMGAVHSMIDMGRKVPYRYTPFRDMIHSIKMNLFRTRS